MVVVVVGTGLLGGLVLEAVCTYTGEMLPLLPGWLGRRRRLCRLAGFCSSSELTDAIGVHEGDDAMDNDQVRVLLRAKQRTTHAAAEESLRLPM